MAGGTQDCGVEAGSMWSINSNPDKATQRARDDII